MGLSLILGAAAALAKGENPVPNQRIHLVRHLIVGTVARLQVVLRQFGVVLAVSPRGPG